MCVWVGGVGWEEKTAGRCVRAVGCVAHVRLSVVCWTIADIPMAAAVSSMQAFTRRSRTSVYLHVHPVRSICHLPSYVPPVDVDHVPVILFLLDGLLGVASLRGDGYAQRRDTRAG